MESVIVSHLALPSLPPFDLDGWAARSQVIRFDRCRVSEVVPHIG
jgi:hypothetical protein